jgi:hypothetical protein
MPGTTQPALDLARIGINPIPASTDSFLGSRGLFICQLLRCQLHVHWQCYGPAVQSFSPHPSAAVIMAKLSTSSHQIMPEQQLVIPSVGCCCPLLADAPWGMKQPPILITVLWPHLSPTPSRACLPAVSGLDDVSC